ncbi:MAG: NUDIX hydrolase [Rhodospirillaceae bacterium]|nr:NUDIX hydrolase [Rhodospirillaceae bacterium]MYH35255.1 NUDIX hydrolase [Rhodospirillaceae bacterium]MYK15160.1 NUDIX hydrolase [Rhodospirillaceae bacterium]
MTHNPASQPDSAASGDRPARPRSGTGQSVGPDVWKIPEGDERERLVCSDCGFIHYDNPKIVVGSVAVWEDRVLMCRRAIAPRIGYWTLPAGFMELHERSEDAAAREAWEEARAEIEVHDLFALYNIPRISQVQLFYRATLKSPAIEPGPESTEVRLFGWDELPEDEFAFPSVPWALQHYREIAGETAFAVRTNPPPGPMGPSADGTAFSSPKQERPRG